MPLSTDVNLPRSHAPVFPDRCVRCESETEGKTVVLWTHTIGWWTWLMFMFGWAFKVRVPACSRCGWMIRFQRIGSLAATLVLAGVFLFLVWPHVDDFVARPIRKWVAVGMMMLCASPWLLWEAFFPPAIDITAFSKSVDYEFKNPGDAYEFAELNSHAEWVKVN